MNKREMLWRLLMYRPGLALLNILTWIGVSAMPMAVPLIARAFFDRISDGAPATSGLWWLVVLPVMAMTFRALVTWVTMPWVTNQQFALAALLNRNMLAHILKQPGAQALPCSPGDAVSRFRDDADSASQFLSLVELLSGVVEIGWALLTIVIMARINSFVTLFAVAPILAVVVIARAASSRIGKYRAATRAAGGRVTGALAEIYRMVQAIQLAGAEEHAAAHLDQLNDRRRATAVRESLFSEVLRSFWINTGNLATGLVLLLAAADIRAGRFTVGDFALFSGYLGRMAGSASVIGDLMARYKQAGIALDRMLALMPGAPAGALVAPEPLYLDREAPESPTGAGPQRPEGQSPGGRPEMLERLEIKGLTCRHAGSDRGIREISFSLERGQLTVITGRVGSGKSTLLRAIQGLLPAQAGLVCWNGKAVADPKSHFAPPHSAYTPQVVTLFSESLKENILLGLPEEQADLPGAVRAAVLERDIADLPDGLATVVGPRGAKLSGGQAQRTAAARMFVRRPELLLFDDLSSALDVETEALLWQRLRSEHRTCLAASHRRAALQAADQVLLLVDGAIAARGTAAQLLAESAEFREIWSAASDGEQAGA